MALQERTPPVSNLRAFPRRKTSVSQNTQHPLGSSWEHVSIENGHELEEDAPMDLDLVPRRSVRPSSVLDDLVDRVGREVESFAEKLDAWKNRDELDQDEDARYDAALVLIGQYKNEATDVVKELLQGCEEPHYEHFKDQWTARSPGSKLGANSKSTEAGSRQSKEEQLRDWKLEQGTWQLAEDLLLDEMTNAQVELPHSHFAEDVCSRYPDDRFGGDGSTWASFLANRPEARRRFIILKWLEVHAEATGKDLELIEQKLESLSPMGRALFSQGWMNTKEKIKGEKRLRLWDVPIDSALPEIWNESRTDLLVTQLDPDAPTRQQRKLEGQDVDFDNAFWVMCWEMLRRGCSMTELQSWCLEKDQSAVALSLAAYPCEDDMESVESDPIARYQWREVCLQNATKGSGTIHERAVYGLLSGDYESVVDVCVSWEDRLYAVFNTLLMEDFELFVRGNSGTPLRDSRINVDLEDVLHKLCREDARSVQVQGFKERMRVLQGSVIDQSFAQLALTEGIDLSKQSKTGFDRLIPTRFAQMSSSEERLYPPISEDHHMARVFAHLYLIYRRVGLNLDDGDADQLLATENIIGQYLSMLRSMGMYNLIPLYATFILRQRAEMALGVVCRDIVDTEERSTFLGLIQQSGFDDLNVLLNHYRLCDVAMPMNFNEETVAQDVKLLQHTHIEFWPGARITTKQAGTLTHQEDEIIDSIEWFQSLEGDWGTTFATATRAALKFLSAGDIDAAVALISRVPYKELSISKSAMSLGKAIDVFEVDENEEDEAMEFESLAPMTRGRQRRSVTPQEPRIHIGLLKQHARVYYELDQLVAAILSLWEWRRAELVFSQTGKPQGETKAAIDRVVSAFVPILEPEYLQADISDIDIMIDEDTFHERTRMLELVRKFYLPEMILAFDSALQYAGFIISRSYCLDSLDLANKVAKNEALIEVFQATGRMGELVTAFACNSKALLSINQKKLGEGGHQRSKGRGGRTVDIWNVST